MFFFKLYKLLTYNENYIASKKTLLKLYIKRYVCLINVLRNITLIKIDMKERQKEARKP